MSSRRMLPVGIILALVLLMSVGTVSAQEEEVALDGSVSFRDADASGDSLVVELIDVPFPQEGQVYQGWLFASATEMISIGVLEVAADGRIDHTYVSPDGTNLITRYSAFAISLEPADDPEPGTMGTVVYADSIAPGAYPHIHHLAVAFDGNPERKAIATALMEQVAVALSHASLARGSESLENKQLHSQHVINIVEGEDGENFDAGAGNPGDGRGILHYAQLAIDHAELAKAGAPDDQDVEAMADEVIAAANNVIDYATTARNNALEVVNAESDDEVVRLSLENAVINMTNATEGTDDDGDGAPGSVGGEGGAATVYFRSQDIGRFVPVQDATPTPVLPVTGDTLVAVVALSALLAGFASVVTGGLLLFRRRRPALA